MDLLKRLFSLEKNAEAFGFKWETKEQILAQIHSECHEIRALINAPIHQDQLQEEVGDLLHAAFSLCIFCNFDPIETLKNSVNKFEKRLNAVKHLAKTQGFSSLEGLSFDELMVYWEKAKHLVG